MLPRRKVRFGEPIDRWRGLRRAAYIVLNGAIWASVLLAAAALASLLAYVVISTIATETAMHQ